VVIVGNGAVGKSSMIQVSRTLVLGPSLGISSRIERKESLKGTAVRVVGTGYQFDQYSPDMRGGHKRGQNNGSNDIA
jgi:hypothetical protein